ncbi:MAG TPA: hypothetical protein VGR55_18595 [Candidatus Acidoferrum sp.]|nr:hypothetical protein [Candidatus Acidoferrum sp.]
MIAAVKVAAVTSSNPHRELSDPRGRSAHENGGMTIGRLKIVCFGVFAAIVLTSCNQLKSKDNSKETDALNHKMKRVQAEMVRQAQEPADKAAIESGRVFVNIEALDMSVVGVAVPNRLTGKRIHVSFLREHFDQAAVDVLAREGLVDYNRALASSK